MHTKKSFIITLLRVMDINVIYFKGRARIIKWIILLLPTTVSKSQRLLYWPKFCTRYELSVKCVYIVINSVLFPKYVMQLSLSFFLKNSPTIRVKDD